MMNNSLKSFNSFQSSPITTAITLVDLLQEVSLGNSPDIGYTFLIDGESETVTLSYRQLDIQARAIAVYLQSICQPGDRALLLYQPSLEYITAFFGCLYAGVVAVPAYPPRPNRSLARLQSIINDAQAQVVLTSKTVWPTLTKQVSQTPELQQIKWIATDSINENLADQWQRPAIDGESLAFLQYTSGSTAAPKGVMITHGNLLHNSQLIHQGFAHSPHSRGVIWLPPYHDMGLIGGIIQPLYGGFPVLLMSPLIFLQSPIRWLQAITRYGGTTSGGPNFAYDLCVRKITDEQKAKLDLSSWQVAFNGAEPINYQVLEQFAETFAECGFDRSAFYPCYGMAEATLIISGGVTPQIPVYKTIDDQALKQNQILPVSLSDNTHHQRTLVGCGQTFADQQIKIIHPDSLQQLPDLNVGEIWVKGPSIAQGYWGNQSLTTHTFQAYVGDEGPFLRTGDLGFLEKGELFITGRLKDVIIINGQNYYPQDIEWTVEQSHPLIRAAGVACFGVNVAGEEKLVILAEVDRLWRELRNKPLQADMNGKPNDAKDLFQGIRRAVSQNHDLSIHATLLLKPGSLPKTSSGKIQRHICRQNFLDGTLQPLAENPQPLDQLSKHDI